MKRPNLRIIGIKEELQIKGTGNMFNKIIEENFPKLKKDIPMKVQVAYRTPNGLDQKKKAPHHTIFKTQNVQNKERILRVAKEKDQVTYKDKPIRNIPDFSVETMKVRKSWTDVLQTLRDHRCQTSLLYPVKFSITIDGENKVFHDKIRFK